VTEEHGIPLSVLNELSTQLHDWEGQYLHQVGVPTDSTAGWDFLAAISACAPHELMNEPGAG
jgi:hypothetical protein